MIRVEKREPDDPQWRRLRKRCDDATADILNGFDPNNLRSIKEDLYQSYMPFLHRIFNDKCAYCEETLSGQPGDVEHFRPKGRVCDAAFRQIQIVDQAWGAIPHPGYYWLVYDWENLLPSCADCNRFRWHGDSIGAGKADRFPVQGNHAFRPEHLGGERPLLIDPTKIDPEKHLHPDFDKATRQIIYVADTPEAVATIEMFGLNKREKMVRRRTLAYAEAEDAFNAYLDEAKAARFDDRWEGKRLAVNDMWEGRNTFTAVRRFALRVMQLRLRQAYIDIPLPLPALRPG